MTTPKRKPLPMVTCDPCGRRRRSVALWYLPRRGTPVLHAGLPEGWRFIEGAPACPECVKRDAERATRRPTQRTP